MITFTLESEILQLSSQCVYSSGPLFSTMQLTGKTAGGADTAESWGRGTELTRRLLFEPISWQDWRGLADWVQRVCFWSSVPFTATGPDWSCLCRIWNDELFFPVIDSTKKVESVELILRVES